MNDVGILRGFHVLVFLVSINLLTGCSAAKFSAANKGNAVALQDKLIDGSPRGQAISLNSKLVCAPPGFMGAQFQLKNSTQVTAVLIQVNPEGGEDKVLQVWDSLTDTARLRAQLFEGKFTLNVAQTLSEGMYKIALFDSNQVLDRPSMLSPLSLLNPNSTAYAFFVVDSAGVARQRGELKMLYALVGDSACQGLEVIDPLMINLGDQPIQLSSQEEGVSMDLTGSGLRQQISWPVDTAHAAFLVNDLRESGEISAPQLFGNYTVGPDGETATNGYDALAKYDGNQDGVVDEHDAVWSSLKLWFDLNRNGFADKGELVALSAVKITAIVLPKSKVDDRMFKQRCEKDLFSNLICHERGAYVRAYNSAGALVKRELVDVDFSPSGTRD